jgi:hypothetical protein
MNNEDVAVPESNMLPLKPFKEGDLIEGINLSCSVELVEESLLFNFSLEAEDGAIVVPEKSKAAVKNDRLWKNTCFEFFISETERDAYFELNFSPSGDWNFLAFDDYRETSQKQSDMDIGKMAEWSKDSDGLTLTAKLPLSLFSKNSTEALDIGIAAVLEHSNAELSYWALAHNGPKPNFHNRDSMCLSIS